MMANLSRRIVNLIELPDRDNFIVYFDFVKISEKQIKNRENISTQIDYYYYGLDLSANKNGEKIEMHRINLSANPPFDELVSTKNGLPYLNLSPNGIFGRGTSNPNGTYFFASKLERERGVDGNEENDLANFKFIKINIQTLAVEEIEEGKITLPWHTISYCWHRIHFIDNDNCYLKFNYIADKYIYRIAGSEHYYREIYATKIFAMKFEERNRCHISPILFTNPPTEFLNDFSKFNDDCRVLMLNQEIDILILDEQKPLFYCLDYCNNLFVWQAQNETWMKFQLDVNKNSLEIDQQKGKKCFHCYFNKGCYIKPFNGPYFRLNIDHKNGTYFFKKLFRATESMITNCDGSLLLFTHWKCFEFVNLSSPIPSLQIICLWKLEEIFAENGFEKEVEFLKEKYVIDKNSLLLPMNNGNLRLYPENVRNIIQQFIQE